LEATKEEFETFVVAILVHIALYSLALALESYAQNQHQHSTWTPQHTSSMPSSGSAIETTSEPVLVKSASSTASADASLALPEDNADNLTTTTSSSITSSPHSISCEATIPLNPCEDAEIWTALTKFGRHLTQPPQPAIHPVTFTSGAPELSEGPHT
jgi:hypothetical protein